MPFVEVQFVSDADTMTDEALDRLAVQWEGWDPSDGDLEVIVIEAIAPMASEAAEVASIVPDSVFRNYGTKLIGLPYTIGQPAYGMAIFTAIDNAGYQSPDMVELGIDGYGFTTDTLVIVPPGLTSVEVPITAVDPGSQGNNLTGVADLVTSLAWISDIAVPNGTEGGFDEENDAEYQDRLSDLLQLQSTTLVTARDYELLALYQPGIGRATATFDTARKVTVAVTDDEGEVVDADVKVDLALLYEDYRQVNTQFVIADPVYATIDVVASLVSYPDQDPAALIDDATAAVANWLSPANWGRPVNSRGEYSETGNEWVPDTIVHYSELLRVLAVPGTRYVNSATIAYPPGVPPTTGNINISGAGPAGSVVITRPGTITITAT